MKRTTIIIEDDGYDNAIDKTPKEKNRNKEDINIWYLFYFDENEVLILFLPHIFDEYN